MQQSEQFRQKIGILVFLLGGDSKVLLREDY